MFSEDKIIESLKKYSCGFIGDDAAVIPLTQNTAYVLTKDILVEDVHFRVDYFTPEDLAHKALHVNLSDIAAMGASPLYVMCGLSIPSDKKLYAFDFLNALTKRCSKENVILIGGDTTTSKRDLFISITVIGQAERAHLKYRNTGSNGDIICVMGALGRAHLGFEALEQKKEIDPLYLNSFLRPTAKLKEGAWAGKKTAITSMMDLSDGLYRDLKRLCQASNKKGVIDVELLENKLDPLVSIKTALEGAEDYGLLITISKTEFECVSREFLNTFGYDLTVIGHLEAGEGLVIQKDFQEVSLSLQPFTHFGEEL